MSACFEFSNHGGDNDQVETADTVFPQMVSCCTYLVSLKVEYIGLRSHALRLPICGSA
jgi:hypothetical protein